jgi:uncharacterized protein
MGTLNPIGCAVSSRYNFSVPTTAGVLLYNANTGAILEFRGKDALELGTTLSSGLVEVSAGGLPESLHRQLLDGGFLVPSGTDEVALIRERFKKARGEAPVVITLTTTMDCNLGCYYCYESRSDESLRLTDIEDIVNLAREKLFKRFKQALHIDWYGGEPLLNLSFIEEASKALQRFCLENHVRYSASVISNGTRWPNNVQDFITTNCIRQVQISFDGLRENHNRRRRYRDKNGEGSSFDQAVALVDDLLDHVRVDIRINIDRWNQADLLPFVEFVRTRGWFNRKYRAVIQPARLSSYSLRSSFMRNTELSMNSYDTLRAAVRAKASAGVTVEESEVPDGYPHPKTSVCAALAYDSEVIGADGLKYRCGLQVGEVNRAVGNLRNSDHKAAFTDAIWWDNFDPTVLPNCSRCSFLPVCLGGCPKKHLENDTHALNEQSIYWRKNLPRLIAEGAGYKFTSSYEFTEVDQFR